MIPKNATHQKIRDTLYHAKRKNITLDITRKEFKKMDSRGYWDGEPVYVYIESEGWVFFNWIIFTVRYYLSRYMDENTQETLEDITHIKRGYFDSIDDKTEILSQPVLSQYSFDNRSILVYTQNHIYALTGYGTDDIVQFFHLPRSYDKDFKPDIY